MHGYVSLPPRFSSSFGPVAVVNTFRKLQFMPTVYGILPATNVGVVPAVKVVPASIPPEPVVVFPAAASVLNV
ncbi:hypothetical protein D3C72_2448410 [compost metagenome]